jgi:hypothetical protein
MLRPAALVLLLIGIGSPTIAQTPPPAAAADAVVDKSSPDYKRCRRIEVTGSRARKEKVCKTNAQWDAIARAGNETSRDQLERSQSLVRPDGM